MKPSFLKEVRKQQIENYVGSHIGVYCVWVRSQALHYAHIQLFFGKTHGLSSMQEGLFLPNDQQFSIFLVVIVCEPPRLFFSCPHYILLK